MIDRGGEADGTHTTFSVNNAPQGNGGAVMIVNTQTGGAASKLVAKNVTFSTNAVKPPSGHGDGIYVDTGQVVQLGNTIVDEGSTGSGTCTGTVTSLGHNLDSGSGCNFNQPGDIQNGGTNLDSPGLNVRIDRRNSSVARNCGRRSAAPISRYLARPE